MCGGGGVQRVRAPPPFGPQCRFFNIGPKVGPPFFACRPKMDPCRPKWRIQGVCVCDRGDHPAPLGMWMTSHGQCPRGVCVLVNVQEWGCFSNVLRADDVTRTMVQGGGVLVKNPVSAPGPLPLSKILDPRLLSYPKPNKTILTLHKAAVVQPLPSGCYY